MKNTENYEDYNIDLYNTSCACGFTRVNITYHIACDGKTDDDDAM